MEMLENRQEFRKVLVNLLKTEEVSAGGAGRGQLERRYHYFITRGLSMRTSPFQKSWVSAILALVPKHLRYLLQGCQALQSKLRFLYNAFEVRNKQIFKIMHRNYWELLYNCVRYLSTTVCDRSQTSCRNQMGTCQSLLQQLQRDYEHNMRKVAVDFVLNSGKPRPRPQKPNEVTCVVLLAWVKKNNYY